jgi:N-acetylglucosaminyl-diphospho-decaprenol L-rhamnosyltransferase
VNAEGSTIWTRIGDDCAALAVRLSYCVVNTNGREHLLACLAAIRDTHPPGVEHEVLVLDNASEDGSAEAVRELDMDVRLIERPTRAGKAENDTALLREADGEHCLLLNEDSELCPGAATALLDALDADRRAAAAGAQLVDPRGEAQPCAWRLPGVGTALIGALFLHRVLTVQSRGERTRAVGWVQSSAMLIRRAAAEQVGYLDPAFFVYSDETDLCKRLGDAGWRVLYVPAARAVHHEQLATDPSAGERRIVEFHRNRDRYVRKHHGPAGAAAVRALTAWAYALRTLAALGLPGHDPRWYWLNARQALRPGRGEGLREAAEQWNRARGTLSPL